MADCSYTPAQIDKFTLADIDALYEFWGNNPPVRTMVAGYLGIKPGGKTAAKETVQRLDGHAMATMFPGGVMRAG